MNMDSFFNKADNVMRAGQKVLDKVSREGEKYIEGQLRSKTKEELRAMAQKIASEGSSSQLESMLYQEMHRRGMV